MKLGEIIKLCQRIYCENLMLVLLYIRLIRVTRWRGWNTVYSHPGQGAVRLDQGTCGDPEAVELHH